jgi:hypothetical protein
MNLRIVAVVVLALPMVGCDVVFVDRYPRRGVVVVQPAPVVVAQPAPPPTVVMTAPPPAPAVVAAPPPLAPGTVVVQPAPVVVQPAPVYVEEGAVVNGVVVAEPVGVDSYVLIDGGWYYWHPGFRCWVHAHRPYGWRPRGDMHVYHGWGEHPMYRR